MSDMRCQNCGLYGIHWVNLTSWNTHTKCPHCGGINCQEPETIEGDEDDDE